MLSVGASPDFSNLKKNREKNPKTLLREFIVSITVTVIGQRRPGSASMNEPSLSDEE